MTNDVPAPPMDPPNTQDGSSYGGSISELQFENPGAYFRELVGFLAQDESQHLGNFRLFRVGIKSDEEVFRMLDTKPLHLDCDRDPPEGCLDCFWSIEVSVPQQPCIFSWNLSSPYGNNNGYCRAIYDGCNSEILLGHPFLLSTTISLEGTPSPKSFVIRVATSDTVGALYFRADVQSLRSYYCFINPLTGFSIKESGHLVSNFIMRVQEVQLSVSRLDVDSRKKRSNSMIVLAVYSKRSLKLSSLSNGGGVNLNLGSNTLPFWQHSKNVGLIALLPLLVLSSYHIWALQLRHSYDGGPKVWETAFGMVLARKHHEYCSVTWFLEVEAIAFRFLPSLVLF
ncbi:hypothetical protein Tco_0281176 [Tanacetum coccineum]